LPPTQVFVAIVRYAFNKDHFKTTMLLAAIFTRVIKRQIRNQLAFWIAVYTVLPVERWMLILAARYLAECVGVLATVKNKTH
jgi:hypothetical protein